MLPFFAEAPPFPSDIFDLFTFTGRLLDVRVANYSALPTWNWEEGVSREFNIAVLGLGHVGLPTALGLADLGWSVIGSDDDLAKAKRLTRGEVPFYEPGVEELLRKHLDKGRFVVETDVGAALKEGTVLFVCVGTPQGDDGAADLSYLAQAARAIASNLNGYKLIVEKSTTPVQTADRLRQSILRQLRGTTGGSDDDTSFDVAVNPEFLREGSALSDFFNPDRIVLGVETDRATDLLLQIYRPLLDRMGKTASEAVVVTDINTAEIIKHASNAFLATKVSFVNMVADLCEATGANVEDVASGMGMDPRIGSQFLEAGIGFGGYCLPKDLRAFGWVAKEQGVDFSLLQEVERVNERRVEVFLSKLRSALWVIKGKTIAVWGLSFKPGTDDIREAPSLGVIQSLRAEGALLRLHDPQAMGEFKRVYPEDPPGIRYSDTAEDAADGAEAVLILTEWPQFLNVDMGQLRKSMSVPLIVDGRNLLEPSAARGSGFEYYSIGRQ